MFYLEKNKLNHKITDWPKFYKEQAEVCENKALKAYYQAGTESPTKALNQTKLVALDLETTGLDAQRNSIVSVGLVPFSINRIYLSQAKYWVVKPRGQLNESSIVIHGITHSEIEQAQDFSHILAELLAALSGKVIVAHCASIEKSFLNKALQHRIKEGIQFPVIDTMHLEAAISQYKPLNLWDRFLGREAVSLRLSDARNRYHLPFYKPHHALTDALACAELLQAQIAYAYSDDIELGKLWE